MRLVATLLFLGLSIAACTHQEERATNAGALFQLLTSAQTGIDFENNLEYSEQLNPYTFRSFYNGGGVGLGDFDQDGLVDIFFAGNMVSNRIYRNKGNLQFEDVTEKAGFATAGVWTTGVSVADVNSDGLPDIYLCKSGPPGGNRRKNELFINQGNFSFSEAAAEFGLDFEGLSVHAGFFDYDKDGDLDCYLLNNSIRSVGGFDLRKDQRNIPDPAGGNRLLRNDDGKFVDVSQQAGIYSSRIGFGLGVTIGDVNNDGWQDMYVSNDFFERDYLYMNNQDGTFTESLVDRMREISLGSMGADMADLTNDGFQEIFVTEMLPEHDARLKTTSQFENYDKFKLSNEQGYFRQMSRNTFQLNNGDGTFSEVSRFAGMHATDWSWGALLFDMDNDGYKDVFVANGIYKDLIDQDYVNFIANPDMVREILMKEKSVIKRLVDSIPSNKLPNYAFKNEGNLAFSNRTVDWGFATPTHSNGSAYGDLDNDGDLDLVLSNVNMPAMVYENQTREKSKNHSITFALRGEGKNTYALGARVHVLDSGRYFFQELSPMRGFMSTVDSRLIVGVGAARILDSVVVEWPSSKRTLLLNVKSDTTLTLSERDAMPVEIRMIEKASPPVFVRKSIEGLSYAHVENEFVDFDRDRLLFNMNSNEGPCGCKGDVNRDGRDDYYAGGAAGTAGALFLQTTANGFRRSQAALFEVDKDSEDTDCVFLDANGDGWLDLYVASGGSEFSSSSSSLLDRLYVNKNGLLSKSPQALPSSVTFESSSTVSATDFDGDGDMDLFVGVRLIPFYYGLPASSYLLLNDGKGNFSDVTAERASGLKKVGLVTDSEWADLNGDQHPDLIIVGEWMPVKVFIQEQGTLVDRTEQYGFGKSNGWYHAVRVADLNGDSKLDLVVGNHGLNSRFKASVEEPVSLYINDFDQNGTIEQITTRYDSGVSYPLVLRQDLVAQIPSLKKKYLHFKNYRGQKMNDVFGKEQVDKSVVLNAYDFETAVWINRDSTFERHALPMEAQFTPVYAIAVDDVNRDGNVDVVLGGNLYRAKPETGIYDGSYGTTLLGNGSGGFSTLPYSKSGFSVKGEIRSLQSLKWNNKKIMIVGKSGLPLEYLIY